MDNNLAIWSSCCSLGSKKKCTDFVGAFEKRYCNAQTIKKGPASASFCLFQFFLTHILQEKMSVSVGFKFARSEYKASHADHLTTAQNAQTIVRLARIKQRVNVI